MFAREEEDGWPERGTAGGAGAAPNGWRGGSLAAYPPWQVIWEDRRGKTGIIYVAGQKVILFGQPAWAGFCWPKLYCGSLKT